MTREKQLEEALRQWKCRRCRGSGKDSEHLCKDNDHDWCKNYKEVPCEACFATGLNRIASLALGLREESAQEKKDKEDAKRGVYRTYSWD